jgi:hypothetical protein
MKLFFLLLLTLHAAFLHAELTDAETLTFLQKQTPELYQKVAPLEKSDPEDFRSAMDDAKKAATDHAALIAAGDTTTAAAYLKMYALDFQAITLADKIVLATDEAEKEKLTVKLKSIIAASVEQWTIVEQARIRRLEAELAKLKSEFEAAITDKSKVIEKDTASLIEECRDYQKQKLSKKK